jgi:hypothetical protein
MKGGDYFDHAKLKKASMGGCFFHFIEVERGKSEEDMYMGGYFHLLCGGK